MKAKYILALLAFSAGLTAAAQQPMSPEEEKKQLLEDIDKQVEKLTDNLKLADWQVFYLGSIMVRDYTAMQDELRKLSDSKVSNPDFYIITQDKLSEEMYNAFRKVLNDEQWAKYLKMGAAGEKKARDKREAKRKK